MTDTGPAFRMVMRGYDPIEVDRRLAELTEQLASQAKVRAHAQAQRAEMPGAVERPVLRVDPVVESNFAALGVQIGQILSGALEAAAALTREAEAEAEATRAALTGSATQQRMDAERQAATMIEEATLTASRILDDAEKLVKIAREHAADLQARADRDCEDTARRAAMLKTEAARKAEQIVAEATSQVEGLRSDFERELAALTERRDRLVAEIATLTSYSTPLPKTISATSAAPQR